jgi:hypothetical protein
MNSICWSIDAISWAFNQETEKNLSTFINFLINLDYEKVDSQDKTEITMALVEVIFQYPRFFSNFFPIFSSFIDKLFHSMDSYSENSSGASVKTFRFISESYYK